MNVPEMVAKYRLTPKGVIQVGSHHGEEIPMWEQMGIRHMHFEPILSNWTILKAKYPNALALPVALGNKQDSPFMFIETVNGGQSCSVLQPKRHLDILPWIEFIGMEQVCMIRLDDSHAITDPYNFMYVDVQGYELEVFKGCEKTLEHMDFLFTEVNQTEVFEGCAQLDELDRFLSAQGFKRVETDWHGGEFGDALFIR